jgi:PilZ domain
MLHQTATALAQAPEIRLSDNPADRRAHPRIPSAQLRVSRVRIPHRPAVSLVDLSSGGALLELPFQMQPETRLAVQLQTPVEQVEVPFQLLRCYVADLKGGVRYHAAGAFDNLLNLQAMIARASSAMQRLIATLERLQSAAQKAAGTSRDAGEFNEILAGAIVGLRRGESLDLVTLKVKARLTQSHPSLAILPTTSPQRDALSSVECFGLTFKSRQVLSANDRRFLKANGQVIWLLEDCRREMREESEPPQSSQVIYSAAEWLAGRSGSTLQHANV